MVFCWPFFFLLTVARFLGVSFRAFYGRFLVLPKKLHPAIVPKLSPRDLLYSSVPRPAFFYWTSLVPLADVYEKLKITSKQPLTFIVWIEEFLSLGCKSSRCPLFVVRFRSCEITAKEILLA